MTLVVSMEKEKAGAVYVRDVASHRLSWLISEGPVLSGRSLDCLFSFP